MINAENNYNLLIKKRLYTWKQAYESSNRVSLNISAIAKAMEQKFGLSTSPAKIGAMFNTQSEREVKLPELVALAQMFNIPHRDICEFPNAPTSNMDLSRYVRRSISKQNTVQQLDNVFYEGDYYCYYFKPKHFQDHLKSVEESVIDEAKFTIKIEKGHTTITLEEMKTDLTFDGKPMPSFVLTGDLYHFENTEMAYSFISDPTGRRAMALMFKYLNLSADIRYYMTVGMMTFSLNQTHEPLFQKMAVVRVRQDYTKEETSEILRGILALNTSPIIIDEHTLKQLSESDETMKRLLSEDKALKKCFVFSESTIRGDSFFILDENQKVRKLLKIRKNSLYPVHEIISEPDSFAEFIKGYQQKQIQNNCRDNKISDED